MKTLSAKKIEPANFSLREKTTSPRIRVALDCSKDGAGRTQQQFKEECDINNIMKKYLKTGAVTHLNKRGGEYGYASGIDFREAVELVRQGQELFDELPSSLRSRFNHDPAGFLDFVQDPANQDELIKLGLAYDTRTEGGAGESTKAPETK